MQLGKSTLLSLAFGALLIAAPGLDSAGDGLSYDQASAAKGGNGKGNGGGNGKGASGSQSASKGANGKSGKFSNSTSVASVEGSSKKEKALDHPSSLGRWNATKDFTHPSIQAHIRNGNFNGTIGMLAQFGMALNTLGDMQADAAAAETAAAELSTLLQGLGLGYPEVAPTDPAVDPTVDPTVDPAVDPTLDPTATFDLDLAISQFKTTATVTDQTTLDHINSLIGTVENAPTTEDLDAAQADLTSAEEQMAAASNRSSWEEVRSIVIGRLGLEDVTVTDPATPTEPTDPASEPDPVTEPAP